MWEKDFFKLALIISSFKTFFVPAYRSTDFEVHRNWLAITHSLPLKAWYKNNHTTDVDLPNNTSTSKFSKSEWTLDYPPLFALMEFFLSQIAYYVDKDMLDVDNLNYASWKTIAFQRLSVVVTDVVFILAVYGFASYFNESMKKCEIPPKAKQSDIKSTSLEISDYLSTSMIISILFMTNSVLFMIDHIHFQYNGILFGVLLLSVLMIYKDNVPASAFFFSILLCMKHIYLYISPVFGLYMLKNYCFVYNGGVLDKRKCLERFVLLGVIVASVFAVSFGPFLIMGQMSDVMGRLFPFQRGLSHAYWAPNFWAVYNSIDKVLHQFFKTSTSNTTIVASMTGGMVGQFEHHLLPSIKPIHTFLLTIFLMLPSWSVAWRQTEGPVSFTKACVLCAFTSFLFGWHVHEKAILLVTIPLTLLSTNSEKDSRMFLMMTCVSNISVLPLIFQPRELIIKYLLALMSIGAAFFCLHHKQQKTRSVWKLPLMTSLESLYLIGLVFIEIYASFVHFIVFKNRLEFLPLMLTSLYCSIGVIYSYVVMTLHYI